MFGNANDDVSVKGDFRVRLAAAERARSKGTALPSSSRRSWHPSKRDDRSAPRGLVLRSDFRASPSPSHRFSTARAADDGPSPPPGRPDRLGDSPKRGVAFRRDRRRAGLVAGRARLFDRARRQAQARHGSRAVRRMRHGGVHGAEIRARGEADHRAGGGGAKAGAAGDDATRKAAAARTKPSDAVREIIRTARRRRGVVLRASRRTLVGGVAARELRRDGS